jgi:hypothetical protein
VTPLKSTRFSILLVLSMLVVAGCSADRVLQPCPDRSALRSSVAVAEGALPASPFDALFEAAGRTHGVDPALLRSIAWVETRLHMVGGDERDEQDDHDGQHIVAHAQLQPWNRTDPGPNWPWISYLALVQRHCGEIVVDDSDAFNDRTHARASAPADWTATSATPGYYGGGYRFAPTEPDADDPLVFEFHVGREGSYTVEARWTAGDNRSSAAPFTVRDGAGRALAAVAVDQRTHHDVWRPLATLDLNTGWHRVELSHRGPAGSVVVGDAVRVR